MKPIEWVPHDVHDWATAVEAATAEAGHPSRIYIHAGASPYVFSYSWETNTQPYSDEEQHESHAVFHKALLLAEPLRPAHMQPSPLLEEMLTQ